MKNGTVVKNISTNALSGEMALVNSYARRELSEDEVYLFSVALCDNDVDRDFERFTLDSLNKLSELFVGKTGILDHNPTAKNQKARIISCHVEAVEGAVTAAGDPLYRLAARAYIRRSAGSAELIDSIDSGIVKEVSVGCSVGRTVCSVCGRELYTCEHIKGEYYQGKLCYGELCDPQDAYEFSFVAVPAQRGAGVIKSVYKERTMEDIKKALESEQELTLGQHELRQLKEYIAALEQDAEGVRLYRGELTRRLSEGLRSKGVSVAYDVAKRVTDKLSIAELCALIDAVGDGTVGKAVPQLCHGSGTGVVGNMEFKI